jgi:hypothetical protein
VGPREEEGVGEYDLMLLVRVGLFITIINLVSRSRQDLSWGSKINVIVNKSK